MVARSVEHKDYPVKANVVRLEYFRLQMVEEKEGDLYTTCFSKIDFKGYFPTSLMNLILADLIVGGKKSTYVKLRKV